LYFEFVNKVLLPHTEKMIVASSADLFLMETLDKYKAINLSCVMLEHMNRVMTAKDGCHGMAYGYLLNRVFNYFNVPLEGELQKLSSKPSQYPLSSSVSV